MYLVYFLVSFIFTLSFFVIMKQNTSGILKLYWFLWFLLAILAFFLSTDNSYDNKLFNFWGACTFWNQVILATGRGSLIVSAVVDELFECVWPFCGVGP